MLNEKRDVKQNGNHMDLANDHSSISSFDVVQKGINSCRIALPLRRYVSIPNMPRYYSNANEDDEETCCAFCLGFQCFLPPLLCAAPASRPAAPPPPALSSLKGAENEMELYMDDKWKLSKKGNRKEGGNGLKASAGVRDQSGSRSRVEARSFPSRCASLVKEQRARFYIMRRCVTMLICWRDYR
ncbi:DVL family [Musa troglodytarum]|uniref:DVL family n=1 Tax=Musa troglodytarum TaxID=320322 RepID=A0A9E7L3Q3_9LILI|nr:DVL family [Musa troglodytarum]